MKDISIRFQESLASGEKINHGDPFRRMEKSKILGENVQLKVPAYYYICSRESDNISAHLAQRGDGALKLLVISSAIDRRPSNLDKWFKELPRSRTRSAKLAPSYGSKGRWKLRNPGLKDLEHDIGKARDEAVRDGNPAGNVDLIQLELESGGHAERGEPHEPLLAEAGKQAILVTNCSKSLDVPKLLSTTTEPASYPALPPFTGSITAGFGGIFLIGIFLDTLMWRLDQSLNKGSEVGGESLRSSAPSTLSVVLETDRRRKESVEWVNMVIGKLWNLYPRGVENWLIDRLQPVINGLGKPDYVRRVQVEQFSLGDEPLTVRTVERRTSRRADDLQYHIGVRYTGEARLLLSVSLKWGIIPLSIPVVVRELDVDAELWVKLRMLPSHPWVGQATWAFVSLPKITLDLAPFRVVSLMAIPFLSIFLAKLLTVDLPRQFVRPNKNMIIDYLQGRDVGPLSKDFKDGVMLDRSRSFSGELSVTLLKASRLSLIPYLKTDPYVIFVLGEQVLRSKRDSETSIIGPPGAPVWNQDFKLLVVDQEQQSLSLTLHETIGFTSYPVGSADIDLRTLQDTVPVDRKVRLRSGRGPLPKRFAGELTLRLTYKAYIDADEEEETGGELSPKWFGIEDVAGAVEQIQEVATFVREEAGKVAEFLQEKDVAKEMLSSLMTIVSDKDMDISLPIPGFEAGQEKKLNEIKRPDDSYAPALVSTGFLREGAEVVANIDRIGAKVYVKDGPAAK